MPALPILNQAPSAASPQTGNGSKHFPKGSQFSGNAAIVSLGCSKNTVDSEVMAGVLHGRGFQLVTEPANAELIVVNTCAFLESAVEEGCDTILELSRHKQEGRCRQLIVAGCMVERYRRELEAEFPEVDRFLSTDELLQVGEESATSNECFDAARRPYFLYDESMPRLRATGAHSTYLKISEGCNRNCSFCIIPKIRGKLRSRAVESVVAEVKALSEQGVREINFVAQDLTAYGTDFPGARGMRSSLSSLLHAIDSSVSEPSSLWIRLLYAYPVNTSEELIRTISESQVVCNYLDIPLQHITQQVLKRMQRPLGEKGTRKLVSQIRSLAPEIALRTTFIVGFPGETDTDFENLLEFVREGHFTNVGVFTYSDEAEAAAFSFDGRLPEALKAERKARLMEAQQAVVSDNLSGFVGKNLRVLVDGYHPESDLLLVGRTEWQAPEVDGQVIINSVEGVDILKVDTIRGEFSEVLVSDISGYDLIGTATELSLP